MKWVLRHPGARPGYENFFCDLKLARWTGPNSCLSLRKGKIKGTYECIPRSRK